MSREVRNLLQAQRNLNIHIPISTHQGITTRSQRRLSNTDMENQIPTNSTANTSATATNVRVENVNDSDDDNFLFQRERNMRAEETQALSSTTIPLPVANAWSEADRLFEIERRNRSQEYFNSCVAPPVNLPTFTNTTTPFPVQTRSTPSTTARGNRTFTWTNTNLPPAPTTLGTQAIATTSTVTSWPNTSTLGVQENAIIQQREEFTGIQLAAMHDIVKNATTGVMHQYYTEITLPIQLRQLNMEDDLKTLIRGMNRIGTTVEQLAAGSQRVSVSPRSNSSPTIPVPTNSGNAGNQIFNNQQMRMLQQPMNQVVDAIRSIRFNNNSNHPVPKFNPRKTTALEFLNEVERYYQVSNFHENQYLYLIKSLLPNDVKLWWDHYKDSVETWDEFKGLFVSKYDTCIENNDRMRLLQTRQQRQNEPTDAFIYEMMKMSKIVYPYEPLRQAIERTRNALFHRFRLGLGAQTFDSPEAMLEALKLVHAGLIASDRAMNVKSTLPPLTSYDSRNNWDNDNKKNNNNNQKNGNNKKNTKSSNETEQTNSNYSNDNDQQESQQRGNGYRGRGRYRGYQSYRGNRSGFNNNREDSQKQSENSSATRGGHNGTQSRGGQNQSNDKLAKVQCMKCRGHGHMTKSCPNKTGIAMSAESKEKTGWNQEGRDDDPEDEIQDEDDLN